MHLLKSIVIGLGVLIFLGLGLLGYGFIQKTNNPDWRLLSSSSPPAHPSAPEIATKPFAEINLGLAEGCAIAHVSADGARAYLTIAGSSLSGTCNRVIVIDTVQGRVLGTIKPGK